MNMISNRNICMYNSVSRIVEIKEMSFKKVIKWDNSNGRIN